MPIETVVYARVPVEVWRDSIEPEAIEKIARS
jgi:hypothetical protein